MTMSDSTESRMQQLSSVGEARLALWEPGEGNQRGWLGVEPAQALTDWRCVPSDDEEWMVSDIRCSSKSSRLQPNSGIKSLAGKQGEGLRKSREHSSEWVLKKEG